MVHAAIARVQLSAPMEACCKRGHSALLSLSGFHHKYLLKIQACMMTQNLLTNLTWRSAAQSIAGIQGTH
jgi:hypothetical protein